MDRERDCKSVYYIKCYIYVYCKCCISFYKAPYRSTHVVFPPSSSYTTPPITQMLSWAGAMWKYKEIRMSIERYGVLSQRVV